MSSRVSCLCALACASLAVLGSGSAHAQTAAGRPANPQAVAHFQQGNAHYKVREFDEAAKEYKAGELIEAAAIFDFNLGQCYRQLAKYEDAIWHYDRYLRSGVATQVEVDAINKWIAEMRAEMEQRAKSAPPTEPATMQPAPQPAPVRSASTSLTVEPWYYDGLGWGLGGTGLIAMGVSAALFLDASSLNDDANHAMSQLEANTLHDKASTRSLLGTVIGIGGAGLVVTGVIKLIIHPHDTSSTSALNVGVTGGGLVVFGRF